VAECFFGGGMRDEFDGWGLKMGVKDGVKDGIEGWSEG
jgi:hypothetical protein